MSAPVLSICIVTCKSQDLLRECLKSISENTRLSWEVIVVDNGSNDGVSEMLAQEYPAVRFIQNDSNLGYTRPMNQALQLGQGRFLMQLNPDTQILPDALELMIAFMEEHPEIGVIGPKVLNRDRTLQKSCRRGESTPWAVITYFLGLSRLFPSSQLFGKYQLNYLDEDETCPVAGVAGSCMLIRRELIEQIGYLDERFFAYQEDADFCFQARKAGWQVFYYPKAQIIHYGGEGGSKNEPYRSIIAWHRSYFLYYRKNLAQNYIFLFNWLYYLAMFIKLLVSLVVNFLRKEKIVSARRP